MLMCSLVPATDEGDDLHAILRVQPVLGVAGAADHLRVHLHRDARAAADPQQLEEARQGHPLGDFTRLSVDPNCHDRPLLDWSPTHYKCIPPLSTHTEVLLRGRGPLYSAAC